MAFSPVIGTWEAGLDKGGDHATTKTRKFLSTRAASKNVVHQTWLHVGLSWV